MSVETGELLLALALVYVLVEFFIQPCERLARISWRIAPWGHAAVHGAAFSGLFLLLTHQLYSMLLAGGLIFPGYLLFGWWRSRYPVENLPRFVADQALHCFVLLLLWLSHVDVPVPAEWTANVLTPEALLVILAYLLVLAPTSRVIRYFLSPWVAEIESDGVSLEKAGAMIGYLERILILTFVLSDEYLAIGFVLALKAAYRFKDTEKHAKAEYMLMGTFLSLVLTLAVGLAVRRSLAG